MGSVVANFRLIGHLRKCLSSIINLPGVKNYQVNI